jgi:hypothetical protein
MEAAKKQDFFQVCFQIDYSDNVATALAELHPGDVKVHGESVEGCIKVLEKVPRT